MKLGLQLYSIRLLAKQDFEKALKTVATQGYEGVEFAGFFDIPAQTMNQWLETYQLEAIGSHTSADLLFDHLDEVIAYNQAIGNKRIICPWYQFADLMAVEAFAEKMITVSKKLNEVGMTLYYHNHDHEFAKIDGEYVMDVMARLMSSQELKFELDIYWMYYAGVNPVKYLEKNKARIDIFHAKDGSKQESFAVGSGEVDIDGVMAWAIQNNIEWVVAESESEVTIEKQLEDTAKSAAYLKKFMK